MYNIALSRPSYLSYTDEVCKAVNKVIRSGFIAQGKVTEEFEQKIAEYVGVKHAIAVSSGTAGLFLCLKACGIGPGDEVITTPFSFIASTNVIVHAGAKPVFVDIDRDTYNMDIDKMPLFVDSEVKAILPVDVFGNPFNSRRIGGLWPIILDACESFGSKMQRPFDTCVYAAYPNKQLTTGEGGIICTDNQSIAEYCQAQRNQGRKKGDQWLESSYIGWNFRMTDIQAAIGLVQLNHWEEICRKRHNVYLQYVHNLILDERIKLQEFGSGWQELSHFVFTIECDNRDKVMQYMLSHGIECKPYFPCIHTQKPYLEIGYKQGDFPIAELVSSRTLALPFWTDMSESEVDTVCKVLKQALEV